MPSKRSSIRLTVAFAILRAIVFVWGMDAVAEEKILHSFTNSTTGTPPSSLIFDAAGNLYGTTYRGGSGLCTSNGAGNGCGVVFELTPKTDGGWSEKILHDFQYDGKDGNFPSGSLTFDAAGNLYGTTDQGGSGLCAANGSVIGCGAVFELSPRTGGGWVERILYSFQKNGIDGSYPNGTLIFDVQGSLYGTTNSGGGGGCSGGGCGNVFELTLQDGTTWKEKILYNFNKNVTHEGIPVGGVIFDAAGNLYGVTLAGGNYTGCGPDGGGCGTVFELSPAAGGLWTEKVLFKFDKAGGYSPLGNLIFDKAGNLYGTTYLGGGGTAGAVFELIPGANGVWSENKLHSFGSDWADGLFPLAGLIFDDVGNLYGTAGGGSAGWGVVFELSQGTAGAWTEKIVHTFQRPHDGISPSSGLVFDAAGNLYGATYYGGTYGYGTVFEIMP
jgi:uncharacterized repeat protein (TIGR03803 family)